MYHPFSIAETLKAAWNIFTKNFITIIVYSLITFVLVEVLKYINVIANPYEDYTLTVILFIIVMFIQTYTTLGLYKLTFTLIDSEYYEFSIRQVLPKFSMIVACIGMSLLTAFVFGTPVFFINYFLKDYDLALGIAGFFEVVILIYLAIRYIFCICYIVDDGSGAIESLKQSFHLTHGYVSRILLIILINIVLIVIGYMIPFNLGIIFTYPFVNLVLIESYRKMVYAHQDVDDDVTETI